MRVSLLGVPIDAVSMTEALERLRAFLQTGGQHHVMTPNSEMLVEARRNARFCEVLRGSALNLPDSAGLLLAARLTGQRLPERVTGVDTVTKLCGELGPEYPVFFLGAGEGVGHRASEELKRQNPALAVAGVYSGTPSDTDASAIIDRINASGAHILLVAYGAPVQDLWIAKYLQQLPSVRLAMGIGGTFDFLAGTTKRAPRWVQRCGLEWLWRLLREPRRIGRIFRAVVVFPMLIAWYGKDEKD